MRPTLLANLEEQSVFCGGIVEDGDVFRFSLPPDFDVIDKVIESSEKIKSVEMPEADAMLIFSCVGRFVSLGPMLNQELNGLANTWKKSMAGFFCLGEFGKAEGGDKAEFHGTTCSWVALKEKKQKIRYESKINKRKIVTGNSDGHTRKHDNRFQTKFGHCLFFRKSG